jgi:hypothetical protein
MSSCNSRRTLAALTLTLLLTPSLAHARPQARIAHTRVATAAQPGLIDLFRAGLTQLLAKITTTDTTGTGTSGSGDSGAGVRIDPEGYQASPSPSPTGNP